MPWFRPLAILLAFFALSARPVPAAADPALPKIGHVFIIVLENESFDETFGPHSPAKYLNGLAKQGALLKNYYGIGHFSLDNYLAMISGQAPNPVTQSDCQSFVDFAATGTAPDGQAIGSGCVYPAEVKTIANQLEAKGLSWKAYMEDMGNNPARENATCGHPAIGAKDNTQRAEIGDQYATRHNPFVYFHAIIDTPSCNARVVNLKALDEDLKSAETTPNLVFITPNLCNDGHDGGEGRHCVDGAPGGFISADAFLQHLVPQILASPAFKQDGLLVITFDEAEIKAHFDQKTGEVVMQGGDVSSCCDEQPGPNITAGAKVFNMPDKGPGILGPGGGKIGAVLVSPFVKPGTVSTAPYNHYALLKTLEDVFGLDHLGYAGRAGLVGFGADVFGK
jgi:hypothetical protein